MSEFLKHEPCPSCRKRGWDRKGDNLGVWTDHKYCFSCNFYEGVSPIKAFQQSREFHTVESGIALPSDSSQELRQDALMWLKSYSLTNEEIDQNNMEWSERKELLIFPFYQGVTGIGYNDLIAWQGRYFGTNKEYPKYVTYGIRQDLFHYVGRDNKHTVVLVEDLISAIKVGRVQLAMPLFSSDANKYQLHHIAQRLDHAIIWLDPDKRNHAIRLGQRAESFFKTVRVMFTEDDPKCYSTKAIQELLHV